MYIYIHIYIYIYTYIYIHIYIYTIQTKIIMYRLTKIVDRYSIARDEGRSNI